METIVLSATLGITQHFPGGIELKNPVLITTSIGVVLLHRLKFSGTGGASYTQHQVRITGWLRMRQAGKGFSTSSRLSTRRGDAQERQTAPTGGSVHPAQRLDVVHNIETGAIGCNHQQARELMADRGDSMQERC
jgi:hypothetical protein